jgi:hypothetical protein
MRRFKAKFTKIWRPKSGNMSGPLIATALVFGVVGTVTLFVSHAATPAVSVEPESGTIASPASQITDSTASNSKAVKFGSGGTASCATSTQHVPDGPDGMGGCWPGASNTGVPAGVTLSAYTGPCNITTANTVIDAKDIQCDGLDISANNVTISRSKIKYGVSGKESLGTAFTISDSEIDGALAAFGGVACVNCGVDGYDFTILRTEVKHTNRSAFCEYRCNIQDSWFHAVNLDTSPCPQASSGTCPHASGFRAEQYASVKHSTVSCDFTGPFNDDLGCSADMSGYPDFAPINHNTIDRNLFMSNNVGAGFCVYGGGTLTKPFSNDPINATYIVFTNNVFQRGANGKCGTYGPVTDFITGRTGNVWTNNKYDNGSTVDPG